MKCLEHIQTWLHNLVSVSEYILHPSLRHLIPRTQDVTTTRAAEATMVTLLIGSNEG